MTLACHRRIAAWILAACTVLPAIADDEPQHVDVTGHYEHEWASYRYAYTAAAQVARFTRSRPLIQAHMQLRPIDPATPMAGLRVQLVADGVDVDIPVDAIGRAVLPMSKRAYDADGVLRLNRPKGLFRFSGRYSIKERDDGVYPVQELRAACEQMIDVQRESGNRLRLWGKRCAGVRFVYAADDAGAAVQVQRGPTPPVRVGAVDDHPFEDGSMGLYKVVMVRFGDWANDATVSTFERPLAIGTVYE